MSPDEIFEPSAEAMEACRAFMAAVKKGMKPPAYLSTTEHPGLIPGWHMQMCLHTMLKMFDVETGREMNETQASVYTCAAVAKGSMSGIGVGLASYLAQTINPNMFFEHIVVCCARALPQFTKTEGPMQ